MARVYVADDEKNIRDLIASFLCEQSLEVEVFETGDQLFLRFLEEEADVIILDVMMPGTSGIDIAARIRKTIRCSDYLVDGAWWGRGLFAGLSAGADDYFTKPFSPLKLSLRVKAILSRHATSSKKSDADVIAYEGLTLSEKERLVLYKKLPLKLTNTEFELLKMLLKHQEEAISRQDLLQQIWGYEEDVETRVTDDTIKRLRKKLREVDSHVLIETVWGYGFKLTKK